VEEDEQISDGYTDLISVKDGKNYAPLQGINPNFQDTQGFINLQCQFGIAERAPAKSTIFYSAVWEGSSIPASAFFVTMIHGKIGKAMSEDQNLDFI
jgi:hypothetical protein